MGKDISNETIALLVGVGIIISVVGLFLNITGTGIVGITGAHPSGDETGTGTTEINVSAYVDGEVEDGDIDLGDHGIGQVNNSEDMLDWYVIETIGTVTINISANASSSLFDSLDLDSDYYQIHCHNITPVGDGTCTQAEYTAVTDGAPTLLVNDLLRYTKTRIGIQATVPPDETAGVKSGDITFFFEES